MRLLLFQIRETCLKQLYIISCLQHFWTRYVLEKKKPTQHYNMEPFSLKIINVLLVHVIQHKYYTVQENINAITPRVQHTHTAASGGSCGTEQERGLPPRLWWC